MKPYHLAFRCLYAVLICCAYMLAVLCLYAAADPSVTQCNIAQILISLTLLSYSIKIVYIDNLEIGNITRNQY